MSIVKSGHSDKAREPGPRIPGDLRFSVLFTCFPLVFRGFPVGFNVFETLATLLPVLKAGFLVRDVAKRCFSFCFLFCFSFCDPGGDFGGPGGGFLLNSPSSGCITTSTTT